MKQIMTLLKGDLKNIRRDLVLIMTFVAPLLLTLIFRYVIPHINTLLIERLHFTLSLYYPFMISFFLMIVPMLIGTMTGFMLLEDKDLDLLTYFSITPLGKEKYLLYRLSLPMVLNLALSTLMVYCSNLIDIPFIKLLLLIFLASLQAIIVALILVTLASNRVEGLAMSKALGVFYVIPFIEQFIDFKYKLLLGIFPTYYIPKILTLEYDSFTFLKLIVLGLILHLIYLFYFYQKLNKQH